MAQNPFQPLQILPPFLPPLAFSFCLFSAFYISTEFLAQALILDMNLSKQPKAETFHSEIMIRLHS